MISRTKLFLVIASLLSAGACSYVPAIVTEYRIDVQQGNVLNQEMVSQLRPGLNRNQVRFILGTPLLTDMFHDGRWDYIFRFQEGKTDRVTMRRFSVFFDQDGLLERVSGNVNVGASEDLTALVEQTQVVDLGRLDEDAPPLPPPDLEPGLFRRLMESLGW